MLRGESVIPPAQCGSGKTQFAKYTAVITSILSNDSGPTKTSVLGGQTSPCYADATFANLHQYDLLPAAAPGLSYRIDVFLWSADAYAAATNIASIETRLNDTTTADTVRAAALADLVTLARPQRVCKAIEVANVQSVALCEAPSSDAGTEGGSDAATDSGADSGNVDAGMDSGIADAPSG